MAGDFSRRDFLKVGALASGVAAAGLGIGSIAGCASDAAVTDADFIYTCPICGTYFGDWKSLKDHFAKSHPDAAVPTLAVLNINGNDVKVQIEPHWTLRETLQFALGMTGSAKEMCDRGACGSCTILLDGVPALSCSTLAIECVGHEIETIEGIAADETWKPLLDAYVKYDGMQCGYCTPGNLAVAKYLIMNNPEPTEDDIRLALSGNICRCGTYSRHVKAIQEAAAAIKEGGN